jgi:hypothetical protein
MSLAPVAALKAELQILDGRIQAERNDEVRHGLLRGRLEAERAHLLVKLMEAIAGDTKPTTSSDYATFVTLAPPSTMPPAPSFSASLPTATRQALKPDGTPTVRKMVAAALEDAASRGLHQLRPRDITEFIRQRWWPSVESSSITSTVWRMAKDGKLYAENGRYGMVKTNGSAGHENNTHV